MSKLLPVAIVLLIAAILVGFAAPSAHLVIDARSIPLNEPPLVENNVIMIPFRPIYEAFVWTVSCDNEKKTATALLGKRTVQVTIGQDRAISNYVPARLETVVRLISASCGVPHLNRTLIPTSAMSGCVLTLA